MANGMSKVETGTSQVYAVEKKLDEAKWWQEYQLESDLEGYCVQDCEVVFHL